MEMVSITEKIKDIIKKDGENRKIRDIDVANELGISPLNLGSMKSRNSIPYRELAYFCAKKNISINWLLFDQNPETLIEPTNRYHSIKYLRNVHVSAGGGAINWDDESDSFTLEESIFAKICPKSELKNIEALNVVGDSMEPTFCDDDIIFINREKKDISRGGVFVVETEGGVFVKRLQNRIDGKIEIISDNKEYQTQYAGKNEVNIVGKVIGRFGRI